MGILLHVSAASAAAASSCSLNLHVRGAQSSQRPPVLEFLQKLVAGSMLQVAGAAAEGILCRYIERARLSRTSSRTSLTVSE